MKILKSKLFTVILLLLIVSLSYYFMTKSSYKVSKNIDSKYIYFSINDDAYKNELLVNGDTLNVNITQNDTLKLSLHESDTIIEKWIFDYNDEIMKIRDLGTVSVRQKLFGQKKDGDDLTRHVYEFKVNRSGISIIGLKYSDLDFKIVVTIE